MPSIGSESPAGAGIDHEGDRRPAQIGFLSNIASE
jgi:hypothetical protein